MDTASNGFLPITTGLEVIGSEFTGSSSEDTLVFKGMSEEGSPFQTTRELIMAAKIHKDLKCNRLSCCLINSILESPKTADRVPPPALAIAAASFRPLS
jgi:hypothetical protein